MAIDDQRAADAVDALRAAGETLFDRIQSSLSGPSTPVAAADIEAVLEQLRQTRALLKQTHLDALDPALVPASLGGAGAAATEAPAPPVDVQAVLAETEGQLAALRATTTAAAQVARVRQGAAAAATAGAMPPPAVPAYPRAGSVASTPR